ncbi:MAG: serine/threonine protein kinase [Burkholderiales bacterium]|nr:serine/threonine protein kinase [Burkholderiales bacterium]
MPRPQYIDRYRIVRRLGGSGECRVFEAATPEGTAVALKLLLPADPPRADAAEVLARFRREAEVVQRLSHPGIVRLLDCGTDAGRAWLVLELVRGPVLSSVMRGLPLAAALACIDAILDALAHLHEHGVVHRDLKPANIVLDARRGPVLCDFGLAHVDDSLLTQRGDLLGTPVYMAPECFRGEAVDARSDLFSVAVMAYELLAGQSPFAGNNSGEIMLAVVQDEPLPASHWNAELPAAVDEVLACGLAKPRHLRFASAGAFAVRLRQAMRTVASAG